MSITVGELIAILQPLKPETEIRNLQFEITVSVDTFRKKESTPVTITQAPLTDEQRDAYFHGKPTPDEPTGVDPMDPGEGYRFLDKEEDTFQEGDEIRYAPRWMWVPVSMLSYGRPCAELSVQARRKLDPVATTEEPPKQKQWLPGMLADETTPEGTLVRFCDKLPVHWTERSELTSYAYPLCGMDTNGEFFQLRESTGMGIGNWKYAVVVDSAGNYDRELLQKEIDKRKQAEHGK